MKLKQLGMALALAGMLSAQVHASETAMEASPLAAASINAVTQDDLVALFGAENDAKPMQVAALSDAEMRETEGGWLPVAYRVAGGLAGMYGGGYGYLAGGGRDPRGFLGSAVTGFVGGVWSPVTGFRSAVTTFGAGFSSGALAGFGSRHRWW